ncbi:hypothetical protein Vretifemale_7661, partial [Volvox reticuliferus]
GSGGDGDGAPTPHAAGGSPRARGYGRSHSHGQNHLRAISGDLSVGSGSSAATATASVQPPSRSVSNGVTGLLQKLLHSRSNKDQSPSSSDVSMAYDDTGGSMRSGGGGGGGGGRLDQQILIQQQQQQPSVGALSLRRKSVTAGAARSSASLMVPGSRPSHPNNALLPDMETAAAAASAGSPHG